MSKRTVLLIIFCLLPTLFLGCATTGPEVSKKEIKEARKFLEEKAFHYKLKQQIRLNSLGYRLLSHIPTPQDNEPKPYIGLILSDPNQKVKEILKLDIPRRKRGVVVVGVVPSSPAESAGIQQKDVILAIGDKKPVSAWEALRVLRSLKPSEKAEILILRGQEELSVDLIPMALPYWIVFLAVEQEDVNAFASPEQVMVTYGMLRFIQSDDELAVVLAHELAHLTEGHIAKMMGSGVLSGIVGLVLGVGAEVILPGSGDPIFRIGSGAVQAQFSKDFEREADYVGLRYAHSAGFDIHAGATVWERFGVEIPQTLSSNFLSTHPASPERLIRVQKVVQEILSVQSN